MKIRKLLWGYGKIGYTHIFTKYQWKFSLHRIHTQSAAEMDTYTWKAGNTLQMLLQCTHTKAHIVTLKSSFVIHTLTEESLLTMHTLTYTYKFIQSFIYTRLNTHEELHIIVDKHSILPPICLKCQDETCTRSFSKVKVLTKFSSLIIGYTDSLLLILGSFPQNRHYCKPSFWGHCCRFAI